MSENTARPTLMQALRMVARLNRFVRVTDPSEPVVREAAEMVLSWGGGLEDDDAVDPEAWTTTPPTQPGWYWARAVVGSDYIDAGEVGPLRVDTWGNGHDGFAVELRAYVPSWEGGIPLKDFDLWAGPITAPPLP